VTAYTRAARPDLVLSLAIGGDNADAAKEVFTAVRDEHGQVRDDRAWSRMDEFRRTSSLQRTA
jgi:hypothetical protein